MDITQLYDAFENILHIRMPYDEFKILFKKVLNIVNLLFYFLVIIYFLLYKISFYLLILDEFEKRWKYYVE